MCWCHGSGSPDATRAGPLESERCQSVFLTPPSPPRLGEGPSPPTVPELRSPAAPPQHCPRG